MDQKQTKIKGSIADCDCYAFTDSWLPKNYLIYSNYFQFYNSGLVYLAWQ